MKTTNPPIPGTQVSETPALTPRYSDASIGMHWLMVLLFLGIFAAANLVDAFPEDSPSQQNVLALHFSLGLSVFALVWLRLVLRLLGTTPPIVPSLSPWQQRLSTLMHWMLYGLMIAMPLLGWAARSALGKPVVFFGWSLPGLLSGNQDLGERLLGVHETVGIFAYFLIGGHVLLALLHHYLWKDNTLRRMLPR